MAKIAIGLLLLLAAAAAGPAQAAEEHRVALVVGNALYPGARLKNPANDANAVAAKLRALGFEVTQKNETTQRELTRAISQFGQSIRLGSVALFYYAGHGLQVRGRNFLVPVDAQIESEASARSEGVDLDLLLEQLAPARLSMVILDACRNNPYEGRMRAARGTGLAQVDAPKGVLIAYATAPGRVASDGDGDNGLYTAELLKALERPGLKVEDVFKAVRVNVSKATANEQIPWESSSLTGDFYFKPVEARAAAVDPKQREVEAKKQTELARTVESEKVRRDAETESIRQEMEKLRAEIRAMREAPAAAPAKPAVETVSAAPPKVIAKAEPATPPKAIAKAEPSAPPPAPATLAEKRARVGSLLQASRGRLTFSKAFALLFEIENPAELDRLVAAERLLKRLPYQSAIAMAVDKSGYIQWGRSWNQRTPPFAQTEALEWCKRSGDGHCEIIMINGEMQEEAFLNVARQFGLRNFAPARKQFLARLPS